MIITADNRLALNRVMQAVQQAFAKDGYVRVSITGKRRTLDASALYWVWMREVAKAEDQGRTERDIDADMKLEYGFTIRRANDADFDDLLAKTIDKLIYADRYDMAHALAKEIHCTSQMDTEQMRSYLEKIQHHYGALGIYLETKK